MFHLQRDTQSRAFTEQAGRNPKILLERELFEPSNMCYWNGGSSRARGAARVSARNGRTSVLSWSGGQS